MLGNWKLGYGISEDCIDLQRKEHPLGLKRARHNNKRDGKGVFLVPHRRMPLSRLFLIYLSIAQAGTSVNHTDAIQALLRCPIINKSKSITCSWWWKFSPLASTTGAQSDSNLWDSCAILSPLFRHSPSLSHHACDRTCILICRLNLHTAFHVPRNYKFRGQIKP